MILSDFSALDSERFDVCVVGSGPAGLITAFELGRRGLRTLVIESGIDGRDKQQQRLVDAEIVDPLRQPPMDVATARALGGTSRIWGGRCVAFDDIDFETRPHVPHSGWPIRHDAVGKWYATAASYLDCGSAKFSAPLAGAPAT
jgi:choline dehydrogenase-like flavoprotein